MNRVYRFRIYPNKAQEAMFTKTFGSVRFIYNKLLTDNISHYKQTKTKLKRTPVFYKVEFPWLKVVDSLALANSALNFETAMKNFFKNKQERLNLKKIKFNIQINNFICRTIEDLQDNFNVFDILKNFQNGTLLK